MRCRTLNIKEFMHKRGEMFSGAKGITKDGVNLEILKIFEELFNNIYDNFIYECDLNQFIDIGLNVDDKFAFYFRNSSNLPIKVINDIINYDLGVPVGTEVILPYHLFNKIQTSTKYDDDINRLTSGLNGYGLKWITQRFLNYKIIVVYNDLIYKQDQTENYSLHHNINKEPNSFSIFFNIDYSLTKELGTTDQFCFMRLYEMFICLYLHDKLPESVIVNNSSNIIINNKSCDVWLNKSYTKPKKLFEINSYLLSESKDPNINEPIKNYFKLLCCHKETNMKNIIVLNSLRISSADFLDKIYELFNERLFKEGEKKSIEQYLSFLIIGNFNNLVFDSQSKNRITTEYYPDDDLIKKIKQLKMEIFDFIYHNDAMKNYKDKKKFLKSKLNNVNYKPAIKQKNAKSTLILLEGLSALSSVEEASGRNEFCGTFACKGKVINSRKNKYKAYDDDFVVSLSIILDYSLDVPEKKDTFNYNNIHIIADADVDGIHISCLLINIFENLFPKLLDKLYIMRFPLIIDVISNSPRKIKEYYEDVENKFKNPTYCKGLCSYEKVDMKSFFKQKENYLYKIIIDDNKYLDYIFAKETEYRKQLYNSADYKENIWKNNQVLLTKYIEKEYKKFLKSSLKRSIPNILDGFTESIRKIIHVLLQKKVGNQFNLANFVSEVSLATNYHHGNVSLELSCKSLGYSTKNIKLIKTHGTFGTIKYKHHDCGAARYIRLSKPDYLDNLFIKESFNIIPYNEDEGKQIEPKFLLPLLPLILINGVNNVSTGYSSNIPGHKFSYIKNYMKEYLKSNYNNIPLEIPFPKISYEFFKYENNIEENENKYTSKAEIKTISSNKFSILEFPLSYTLENIIDSCNKIEEKTNKILVEDHSDGDNINIIVNGDVNKYNFSDNNSVNITVFDDEEKLCEFKDKIDLFNKWFEIRYKWLIKEIKEIIKCLLEKKMFYDTKYNLIKYFIDHHVIKYDEQKEVSIKLNAESIYNNLYQREVNEENLKKLIDNIKELESKIDYYKSLNLFKYWYSLLD
jgi:DNA topoisomerase-2